MMTKSKEQNVGVENLDLIALKNKTNQKNNPNCHSICEK